MCLLQMHSLHSANASYAFHVLKDTNNKKVKKNLSEKYKGFRNDLSCSISQNSSEEVALPIISQIPEFSILWDGTEEG